MTETLTPQREIEAPREYDLPPPPPPELRPKPTVADVLERVAYEFEEDIVRWAGYATAGGTACAGNAILFRGGFDMARDAIVAMGFSRANDLFDWNDAPGRTKTEVIQALRAAASSARTKEEA